MSKELESYEMPLSRFIDDKSVTDEKLNEEYDLSLYKKNTQVIDGVEVSFYSPKRIILHLKKKQVFNKEDIYYIITFRSVEGERKFAYNFILGLFDESFYYNNNIVKINFFNKLFPLAVEDSERYITLNSSEYYVGMTRVGYPEIGDILANEIEENDLNHPYEIEICAEFDAQEAIKTYIKQQWLITNPLKQKKVWAHSFRVCNTALIEFARD